MKRPGVYREGAEDGSIGNRGGGKTDLKAGAAGTAPN